MLKDQGHKRRYSPKKKKRSLQKFFKRSPQKNVFQKIFQALHKILTIQKVVLSSSRGQANFRGLEASTPKPRTSNLSSRPRTSSRTPPLEINSKRRRRSRHERGLLCRQRGSTVWQQLSLTVYFTSMILMF